MKEKGGTCAPCPTEECRALVQQQERVIHLRRGAFQQVEFEQMGRQGKNGCTWLMQNADRRPRRWIASVMVNSLRWTHQRKPAGR